MELKFYLNKFCKVDNIENYTLNSLMTIREKYSEFLDSSEGYDPDFPMSNFGDGKKGKKVAGTNIHQLEGDTENVEPASKQKPEPKKEDYIDKRNKSVQERALEFLKSKNLR